MANYILHVCMCTDLHNYASHCNLIIESHQGILFLDSMLGVICKRSWQSSLLEEEIKQWLRVLLCLVDITSNRAESYLKDFLATKSGGVTKQFREYIKRGVRPCCSCNFV